MFKWIKTLKCISMKESEETKYYVQSCFHFYFPFKSPRFDMLRCIRNQMQNRRHRFWVFLRIVSHIYTSSSSLPAKLLSVDGNPSSVSLSSFSSPFCCSPVSSSFFSSCWGCSAVSCVVVFWFSALCVSAFEEFAAAFSSLRKVDQPFNLSSRSRDVSSTWTQWYTWLYLCKLFH